MTGAPDAELEAHLRECEACRELAEDDARLARHLGALREDSPGPEGFDELLADIQSEDASTVGKLRALSTSRRIAIGVGAVIIFSMMWLLAGRRADWDVYPMGRMLVLTVAMLIAGGVGVAFALPRIYKPRQSAKFRWTLFALLLLIPFVPALLPMAHEHVASGGGSFFADAGKCFGFGILASAPALLVVRALQRDDDADMWASLFMALAAALAGNVALQLHCPAVDQGHLLVGHAMLGVVYAVFAWLVVRRT